MATPPEIGSVDTGIDARRVESLVCDFASALGDRCADCWALRQCDICFAMLGKGADGDGLRIKDGLCDGVRVRLESALRSYVELLQRGPKAATFLCESVVT
jgi:uncharacterized protein